LHLPRPVVPAWRPRSQWREPCGILTRFPFHPPPGIRGQGTEEVKDREANQEYARGDAVSRDAFGVRRKIGPMSGPIRLYLVDAFTDLAFSGNPAAVCLLDSPRGDRWRQSLAAEMCVSETAYLERIAAGRYGLRWFTPTVEVELCGHATLASAHALWREEGEQAAALCFETRSGKLSARRVGDSIELDLPAEPARPAGEAPELLAALGVREAPLLRNRMDFLLELESEAVAKVPGGLRLPLLRARGGHRRRSRHGGGPLRAGSVLGRAARAQPDESKADLRPRRLARGVRGRQSRAAFGSRRDGASGRARGRGRREINRRRGRFSQGEGKALTPYRKSLTFYVPGARTDRNVGSPRPARQMRRSGARLRGSAEKPRRFGARPSR
jgi:hypothetical protein